MTCSAELVWNFYFSVLFRSLSQMNGTLKTTGDKPDIVRQRFHDVTYIQNINV